MFIQSLSNLTGATAISLYNIWGGVISFIPSLIGAIVVLIIGLIVAFGLEMLVERVINIIKLDSLLRSVGIDKFLERANMKLNSGKFFGALVYWFFVIVFVLAAADVLHLNTLSQFLRGVVDYLPNVIVSVLIVLAAIVIANFLSSLVRASVAGAKLSASKFLGTLVWWIVIVFGLLTALVQLGIAPTLINTVITGLVAMLALAGGIAFGLGGKDYANYLINKLKDRTE